MCTYMLTLSMATDFWIHGGQLSGQRSQAARRRRYIIMFIRLRNDRLRMDTSVTRRPATGDIWIEFDKHDSCTGKMVYNNIYMYVAFGCLATNGVLLASKVRRQPYTKSLAICNSFAHRAATAPCAWRWWSHPGHDVRWWWWWWLQAMMITTETESTNEWNQKHVWYCFITRHNTLSCDANWLLYVIFTRFGK